MGFEFSERRAGGVADAPSEQRRTPTEPDPFDSWRARRAARRAGPYRRVRRRPLRRRAGRCRRRHRRAISEEFVAGGKCLRSTFMYLGWLCGARRQRRGAARRGQFRVAARFRAAAGRRDGRLGAAPRSARCARPVRRWHRERGLSGSRGRFGESAAVLLADLCLVWAEQMLRDSGFERRALHRAWPRYDAMRTELAVGQFADLVNDARGLPTLDAVLDVARRKSGNYTVRRPLEIGAAMAGCDDHDADAARRLRRRHRRGVPAARRPARYLRVARGDRQTQRRRPAGTQGHQRRGRRPPDWPTPRLRRQLAELMSTETLDDADARALADADLRDAARCNGSRS